MLNLIPAHILGFIINILIGIGVSLSVIFMIISGIQLMAAMGNKEKAQRAKRGLWHSIVGLIIVIGSVAAVQIFGNTLGIDLRSGPLGSFIPF